MNIYVFDILSLSFFKRNFMENSSLNHILKEKLNDKNLSFRKNMLDSVYILKKTSSFCYGCLKSFYYKNINYLLFDFYQCCMLTFLYQFKI